ncbi:hypothetical protein Q5P01_003391 [Channa striata]|uniref:Cytochrome c oxidase assembly factor 6 homolog n=1 Tax=Channa striata TaxID=64152 RepID=A0AA88NMC8_CHASR|nr:hypothetical protein Q5P01_003391 [Channa striata]
MHSHLNNMTTFTTCDGSKEQCGSQRWEILILHLSQAEMAAPNSAERKACWDARDQLWKCLDDNNDQVKSCQRFMNEFETKCPAQWVKYFNKRRDFLKYKEKIQTEGFRPG